MKTADKFLSVVEMYEKFSKKKLKILLEELIGTTLFEGGFLHFIFGTKTWSELYFKYTLFINFYVLFKEHKIFGLSYTTLMQYLLNIHIYPIF